MNSTLTMPQNDENEIIIYKDSTYELVSKVAYLIGVPKRIFENEHKALRSTRIDMADSEKKQFFHRYIRTMQLSLTEDGDLVLEFKKK